MAIPLPQGNGMDAFNKALGFDNFMKQMLERNKAIEQIAQHKENYGQKENHFLQNLALHKEQLAHARANEGLQRQIHEQNLLRLKHQNDPNYEFEQLQKFMNSQAGNPGSQQMTPPAQEMGEGRGVFSPEGMQQAQNMPQQAPSQQGGIDMEAIKNSPILRGYFKKHFGIDPGLSGRENVLHGPARDAADLEKLRKKEGENSPVYQNAKAQYEAQVDAKKDLRDLRARTKAGLKVGETEFFDPKTGVPLGKNIPLTAKERESEEGNIIFNELFPLVYKGGSPFSGEGSINRLENAAANYKTDPKSRKLFDDYLLADKALAATTVNEASTLKAGKTNNTYRMLKESLEAQDIPKLVKKLIKEYQIPASASLRASMRYQEALSNARKKARKGTPASQKLYYDPEMQAKHEAASGGESGGNEDFSKMTDEQLRAMAGGG